MICSKCKETRPETEFYKNKATCRLCCIEYARMNYHRKKDIRVPPNRKEKFDLLPEETRKAMISLYTDRHIKLTEIARKLGLKYSDVRTWSLSGLLDALN